MNNNYRDDYDGAQDEFFPFVGIRQNAVVSEDGKTVITPAGGFKFSDERDDPEVLNFILLKCHRGRIMFEAGNPEPTCKSWNFVYPQEDVIAPACAVCPNSKFGTACKETLNMLCLGEDGEPFIYQAKVTSLKNAQQFVAKLRARCKKEGLETYDYYVSAHNVYTTNPKNDTLKYFVNHFCPVDEAVVIEDEDTKAAIRDKIEEISEKWYERVNPPDEPPARQKSLPSKVEDADYTTFDNEDDFS